MLLCAHIGPRSSYAATSSRLRSMTLDSGAGRRRAGVSGVKGVVRSMTRMLPWVRPSIRLASTSGVGFILVICVMPAWSMWGPSLLALLALECFLKPPGREADGLCIDEERLVTASVEPLTHRLQIFGIPHGLSCKAVTARDGCEVGVGKSNKPQGVIVLAEVVYFRSVSRVVVDDDHQRDTQPHNGLHLRRRHQGAAVTGAEDREPVGLCVCCPDCTGQTETHTLEGLAEDEPVLVRNIKEGAGISEEVARIDGHYPFLVEHPVQSNGEGPGIDAFSIAQVLVRDVLPSAFGLDGLCDLFGTVANTGETAAAELAGGCCCRKPCVAQDAEVYGPVLAGCQ